MAHHSREATTRDDAPATDYFVEYQDPRKCDEYLIAHGTLDSADPLDIYSTRVFTTWTKAVHFARQMRRVGGCPRIVERSNWREPEDCPGWDCDERVVWDAGEDLR